MSSLPSFLVLTVKVALMNRSQDEPTDPPDDLLLMHKTLMNLFLQYEHLTKRISNSKCEEGGNQATVQGAVARTSASFLTKEMLKVQVRCLFLFLQSSRAIFIHLTQKRKEDVRADEQALPRYQKRLAEGKRNTMSINETTLAEQLKAQGLEDVDDVAVLLQPLLEQEAQLE